MTQATIDQQVESLELVATKETAAVGTALQGVGNQHRASFSGATAVASQMRQLSGSQQAAIKALEAEGAKLESEGFAEAARMRHAKAAELRTVAQATVNAISADAHVYVDLAEAGLKASVIPAPAKDPAARQLAQTELGAAIGPGGLAAISPLANLAGAGDPVITGECFSDWATRQLTRGLSPREADGVVSAFRAVALGLILDRPENQPTATALAALKRGRGAIDATRQAALLRVR